MEGLSTVRPVPPGNLREGPLWLEIQPLLWPQSLAPEGMSWCQGLMGARQGADTPLL